MIKTVKTNSTNSDFKKLVKVLDNELAIRDGDDHDFYHQFNHIDNIKYVIVLYVNDKPMACGAIKQYDTETMEIKRMFCIESDRGNGYASKVLAELENWTIDLGLKKCILETGINQPEAIALYKKKGYLIIKNYGQYAGVDTSFCFEKVIKKLKS